MKKNTLNNNFKNLSFVSNNYLKFRKCNKTSFTKKIYFKQLL